MCNIKCVICFFVRACLLLCPEHGVLETAWSVWISGQFIFVFRWYERFLQQRVPEMESSVWKITVIVLVLEKSVRNPGHNISRAAKVCPKSGTWHCLGWNDNAKSGDNIARVAKLFSEIRDTILPGVQYSVRNLGHYFARGVMTVSKLGQIIARDAMSCS